MPKLLFQKAVHVKNWQACFAIYCIIGRYAAATWRENTRNFSNFDTGLIPIPT